MAKHCWQPWMNVMINSYVLSPSAIEHLFFTSSELATGMGGGVRLIITFLINLLSTNLHIFIISSEKFCVANFLPELGHTKISLPRRDECVYQRCIYYHDSWIILTKTALEG